MALPPGPWATIAEFLVARFPRVAAAEWAARIAAGDVVDEHGVRVTMTRPHLPHLHVHYYRSVAAEPRVAAEEAIVYRDDRIVVADKPHFLPVTPSGSHLQETLLVRLKRRLGIDTLAPVHRIDRETAGLVLFTIDPASRGAYQALFAGRQVEKEYRCVAPALEALAFPLTRRSRLVDDATHFMRMREVDGEPNAVTEIDRLAREGPLTLYRLRPLTGRRHQLRVHCAALGMPIANDLIYPNLRPVGSDDPARPLQLLAAALAFIDPLGGEPRRFESRIRLQWPPEG